MTSNVYITVELTSKQIEDIKKGIGQSKAKDDVPITYYEYQGLDYGAELLSQIKVIGMGNDGVVNLKNAKININKNSPVISRLLNLTEGQSGQIIIKTSHETPNKEEVAIVGQLSQSHNINPAYCTVGVYDTKHLSFLMPYIKGPGDEGMDLQKFLTNQMLFRDKKLTASESIGKALSEFAVAIRNGQDSMLEEGIFHRDTRCENYLVHPKNNKGSYSASLTDFGKAKFILRSGTVPMVKGESIPGNWLDQDALRGTWTINTELYGRRLAIIESVVSALGIDPPNLFLDIGGSVHKRAEFTLAKGDNGNKETLAEYVDGLNRLIEQEKDSVKKAELEKFMHCFSEYLLNPPKNSHQTSMDNYFWLARDYDDRLFVESLKKAQQQSLLSAEFVDTNKANIENQAKNINVRIKTFEHRINARQNYNANKLKEIAEQKNPQMMLNSQTQAAPQVAPRVQGERKTRSLNEYLTEKLGSKWKPESIDLLEFVLKRNSLTAENAKVIVEKIKESEGDARALGVLSSFLNTIKNARLTDYDQETNYKMITKNIDLVLEQVAMKTNEAISIKSIEQDDKAKFNNLIKEFELKVKASNLKQAWKDILTREPETYQKKYESTQEKPKKISEKEVGKEDKKKAITDFLEEIKKIKNEIEGKTLAIEGATNRLSIAYAKVIDAAQKAQLKTSTAGHVAKLFHVKSPTKSDVEKFFEERKKELDGLTSPKKTR